MSTKLKIILIVFAVILGLFLIQYMVTTVANSSKRESFEEEAPPKKAPKKDDSVTKLKLNVLETIEDVFEKSYKNSDKKPVVFDMLMNKENFATLKEKYEESEGEVKSFVTDFVKSTMKKIDGASSAIEEETQKPMKKVEEKLAEAENKLMLEEFQEISERLDHVLESIAALKDQLSAKMPKEKEAGKKVIEGFENRINYAHYK